MRCMGPICCIKNGLAVTRYVSSLSDAQKQRSRCCMGGHNVSLKNVGHTQICHLHETKACVKELKVSCKRHIIAGKVVHLNSCQYSVKVVQTWQDSEKDDDDDIQKEDAGNADPNGQPAPPVLHRQVNGAHNAITQSLSCPSIWVQLVLPVTCRQGMTSSSSNHQHATL